MYTMSRLHGGRPFIPGGCQVPVGGGICGETRTLDIINEFKMLYEEKIKEIDNAGGGDCLQEKIKLQQDWISDLTEQNEMLVRAVEELEHEATERVNMLEEKLHQSAQCICEGEKKLKDRDCRIQELQMKINDVGNLTNELRCKREECDTLQKEMVDIREALTEEVASKHDTILKLKRDCQELEDRCIQADKQTAFRDDIIKELRKEIKQLKQQVSHPEKTSKNHPTDDIYRKNTKGEQILVINHTRKIVQSGKSTLIYLRHDSDIVKDKKIENIIEDRASDCWQSRRTFQYEDDPESIEKIILKNRKDADEGEKYLHKKCERSVEEHASNCSKCKPKFKNEYASGSIVKPAFKNRYNGTDEIDKTLHLCRSENDLFDFKKLLRPVKDRSKLTNSTMNRCNTFVGSTSDAMKNIDFESRLRKRNVSIPNHIPVKMYVDNLEVNKAKR